MTNGRISNVEFVAKQVTWIAGAAPAAVKDDKREDKPAKTLDRVMTQEACAGEAQRNLRIRDEQVGGGQGHALPPRPLVLPGADQALGQRRRQQNIGTRFRG